MRWFLSSEFEHKSAALIAILKLRVQYPVGQYLTNFFYFNFKFIFHSNRIMETLNKSYKMIYYMSRNKSFF